MKDPVDYIFPRVTNGPLPYWRMVLRGCSQLCFQSNELTGFFVLVVRFVAIGGRSRMGVRAAVF